MGGGGSGSSIGRVYCKGVRAMSHMIVIVHFSPLTIDLVLSGRLAMGGATSSSCPELRAEWLLMLCTMWLFCMEIDVGIFEWWWWWFIGCSTTWPTCDSLSVGVLLGLELLTRLNDEPIDEAKFM
jgi:hypothetical protein